jgi:hypothetical protein
MISWSPPIPLEPLAKASGDEVASGKKRNGVHVSSDATHQLDVEIIHSPHSPFHRRRVRTR